MFFSIVIPAYNRCALLAKALDSVWAQRFTDYEVIVVDDGSTDGSVEYLESLGSRIRLVRQANQGAGVARNAATRIASGDYLAFLDCDDLWLPWTLSVTADTIRKRGHPVMLAPRIQEFTSEDEIPGLQEGSSVASSHFADYLSASGTGFWVGGGSAVYRREDFLSAGGFTSRRINAEDHDLTLRMGTGKGFVQLLEPVTYAWRRHPSSATGNYNAAYEGISYLLEQERGGVYPGGLARSRQRREIILCHARPVALACLKQRMAGEAWKLYRDTLAWHVAQGRWKFLAGFPLMAAIATVRGGR